MFVYVFAVDLLELWTSMKYSVSCECGPKLSSVLVFGQSCEFNYNGTLQMWVMSHFNLGSTLFAKILSTDLLNYDDRCV